MKLVDRGYLALRRGDDQEAVNIFKRALDERKDAKAFVGYGLAHDRLGDAAAARWAFYQALERDPKNTRALEQVRRLDAPQKDSSSPVRRPGSMFRAVRDRFEILDGGWKPFFIKGVNIGLGLPGFFPGEFSVKTGTYRKWFGQIADLGANAVRVYTILPPGFYEALWQINVSGRRLALFQEIWTELPERGNFDESRFQEELRAGIRNAVDVIFGEAVLPERLGHADGTYTYDVSPFLAAFIVGREWESWAVRAYNDLKGRTISDYRGSFLAVQSGTPFEVWVGRTCDYVQEYEHGRFGVTHPVTAVNWPTLDPLVHPSESTYEQEARLQGTWPEGEVAPFDENSEDTESLDFAKISALRGSGIFALYHAYPYYPDFMNNDYQDRDNGYLAYLKELKRHHGEQPVLIAEFGVPASRESAHWQRQGWHQGGHDEREQGRINEILMTSIHGAGMAGGILFSWFDEWFKKNWLFVPVELPAERKPLWFNVQDPEQNYGLMAAYPGYPDRTVSLAGRAEDWADATVLYRKAGDAMAYRFHDGFDASRRLARLCLQHDEGFLYVLLVAAGPIDFSNACYVIGLDTCGSEGGERQIPFNTGFMSPVGLTHLIQLSGMENSRILAASSYDRYLNQDIGSIRPEVSDCGSWVMMLNKTNMRRISKDGRRFFPARVATMSRLRFGSLDRKHSAYTSLADFFASGDRIELRIPWGLINVTDPSSRSVLWLDANGSTRTTPGIRVVAVSYKPDTAGGAAATTGSSRYTDCFPEQADAAGVGQYVWNGWETPIYHTYLKDSYYAAQKMFSRLPEGT